MIFISTCTHFSDKLFQGEPLIFQLLKVRTLLWSFPPPTGTSAHTLHVTHTLHVNGLDIGIWSNFDVRKKGVK